MRTIEISGKNFSSQDEFISWILQQKENWLSTAETTEEPLIAWLLGEHYSTELKLTSGWYYLAPQKGYPDSPKCWIGPARIIRDDTVSGEKNVPVLFFSQQDGERTYGVYPQFFISEQDALRARLAYARVSKIRDKYFTREETSDVYMRKCLCGFTVSIDGEYVRAYPGLAIGYAQRKMNEHNCKNEKWFN